MRKGAIAAWWKSPHGIAFVDEDGKVAKIHEFTSPRELRALQVDPSNDAILWVDGEYTISDAGDPWLSGFVLWTAPFATAAADFKPRRVTGFDSDAYHRRRRSTVRRLAGDADFCKTEDREPRATGRAADLTRHEPFDPTVPPSPRGARACERCGALV